MMPKSKGGKGVRDPGVAYDAEDDEIDLSDIPELSESQLARARLRRPVNKVAISLRVDSDVLDAFKAAGGGYQTRMNRVLREHLKLPRLSRNTLRIRQENGAVGVWLNTDEIEEFIGALEHASMIAEDLHEASNWTWLVIALHTALQGACVCALRGAVSVDLSVLDDKSAKAMWHWLDVERRKPNPKGPPVERLASLRVLYERVQNPEFLPQPSTLPHDTARDRSVSRLIDLRNQFMHFVPTGMPNIANDVLAAIEHLSVARPSYLRHLTDARIARTRDAIVKLQEGVSQWAADRGVDATARKEGKSKSKSKMKAPR
jgi:uncharacterized protein (DUF4415 family)